MRIEWLNLDERWINGFGEKISDLCETITSHSLTLLLFIISP